jgi:hypothetical protein
MTMTDGIARVADTILLQMGGPGPLSAMIGARQFVGDVDFLQFSFRGCKTFNKCRVILTGDDLYTLQLYRHNQLSMKSIEFEIRGLYFDQLKVEFEKSTGLYLTL